MARSKATLPEQRHAITDFGNNRLAQALACLILLDYRWPNRSPGASQ